MINVLDQEERKLFSREVAILHGLNHTNVVKIKAVCYKPQAIQARIRDFKTGGEFLQ